MIFTMYVGLEETLVSVEALVSIAELDISLEPSWLDPWLQALTVVDAQLAWPMVVDLQLQNSLPPFLKLA